MRVIGRVAFAIAVCCVTTATPNVPAQAAAETSISRPARPLARGGARNAYIEWQANPEYDLKGYNVYRQEVLSSDDPTPVGNPVRINGDTLVTKTEHIDTGIGKGHSYCYVLEAVGADDGISERSESSMPPVNGQRLQVYIPDIYANQAGIYRFDDPYDGLSKIAIPIATQCAYDVSTFGIQVIVHLPRVLIQDADEDIDVFLSGIARGFLFVHNAFDFNDDTVELRIAAAGLSGVPLYGAGTLFYVVIRPSDALLTGVATCGPLSFIRDLPQLPGVRLYDGVLNPITLDLRDGQLCGSGLCAAHGDADLDGEVTSADASYILRIAAGEVANPAACTLSIADINADGVVDQADAVLLLRRLHDRELWPDPDTKAGGGPWDSFAVLRKVGTDRPLVRVGDVVANTGAEIEVPVYIENAPETAGCSFDVTFPAGGQGLTFQSVELGTVLANAGFILAERSGHAEFSEDRGFVHVAIAGGDAIASKGPVTAAVLRFLAPKSGSVSVPLRTSGATLTDPYGFTPRYDAPNAPSSANGSVQINGLLDGAMAIVVVDRATSSPIGNAQVYASPGPAAPVTQNNVGVYIFASLQPGEHEFTVNAPGYITRAERGNVPSGDIGTMTIQLEAEAGEGEGEGEHPGCFGGTIEPPSSHGVGNGLMLGVAAMMLLALSRKSPFVRYRSVHRGCDRPQSVAHGGTAAQAARERD